MIKARSVSKRFGSTRVLDGIDLTVEEGKTVLVTGSNGSGKTTLLKLLAGLLRPTSGEISIGGVSPIEARGHIGYLGHDPHLYPALTAEENLRFFASLYDVAGDQTTALLREVGLSNKERRAVRTLSRGEIQRVAIARALLHDPDVLIVDEPLSGLDDETQASIPSLLAREGRTLVIAAHGIDQFLPLGDTVVRIVGGHLDMWKASQ